MYAEAYRDDIAYWLDEEYLVDLENAGLKEIIDIYNRWNSDTFKYRHGHNHMNVYVRNFCKEFMKIVRNPVVRINNRLIELGIENELISIMQGDIEHVDNSLLKQTEKRSRRR